MYDRGRIVDETNGYQCELSKEYLSRFNLEDDDYKHSQEWIKIGKITLDGKHYLNLDFCSYECLRKYIEDRTYHIHENSR